MFEHHFIVRGKDVIRHAQHYLSGLLGVQRRKNIERIKADVAGSDYENLENLQQFISDSPWDQEVMTQVATEAETTLGGQSDTALYVDESSFAKKGNASVGVQRQYCGRLGKVENCQVGVFAALGCGVPAALVDFRLFLPEAWAKDAARCAKAKVPQDKRVHRTKPELALEMIGDRTGPGFHASLSGGRRGVWKQSCLHQRIGRYGRDVHGSMWRAERRCGNATRVRKRRSRRALASRGAPARAPSRRRREPRRCESIGSPREVSKPRRAR